MESELRDLGQRRAVEGVLAVGRYTLRWVVLSLPELVDLLLQRRGINDLVNAFGVTRLANFFDEWQILARVVLCRRINTDGDLH